MNTNAVIQLSATLSLMFFIGCGLSKEQKLVVSHRISKGSIVEEISLPSDGVATLHVPGNWEINRSSNNHIELKIKKELLYFGFPSKPISIETYKDLIGVARKKDSDNLFLGTFGDFSNGHGGVYLSVICNVPESLFVKRFSMDMFPQLDSIVSCQKSKEWKILVGKSYEMRQDEVAQ